MLINIIDRIKLPFRKEKELYSSLYQIIGLYPHNISFYKMALMHKSAMQFSTLQWEILYIVISPASVKAF